MTDPNAQWREALVDLAKRHHTNKQCACQAVRNASLQYAAKGKWVLSQEDERTIEDAALRALRGET